MAEIDGLASTPLGPETFWYAACASQRLSIAPVAVQVLQHRIALWRDAEGTPRALTDRCVHRGAQLSLGTVSDGALACRYHGWRYGGEGDCIHIPSLVQGQMIPKGMMVRAFQCVERDGYVWVWTGEHAPETATPTPITEFTQFNWMQGSTVLNCSALAAIENNLDWCHPVFAHPNTHGQYFINQAMGFQEQSIEMRLTGTGLTVFIPPTTDASEPMPDRPFVALSYDLPDRVTVAFAAGPAGAMMIIVHMIPLSPNQCRQEWMVSTGAAAAGPQTIGWSDDLPKVFDQDREVLESAQLAFDDEGHAFERSVEADAPTLLVRRIYDLARKGRWSDDRRTLTQRRIVRDRS